jgi:hypothetical protein
MSLKRWFYVGAALGAGVLPAHATDLTDLAFLPAAKQLVGSTSFGYGTDAGNVEDTSGSRQYSLASHSQALSQTLDYGITSHWSVWGARSQVWTTAQYDFPGGGRTEDRVTGPQLTVGLTGRLLDQEHHPFDLDVTATVPGSLDIAITRAFQDLTIRADAGVYHGGGGEGFDLVRAMDTDVGRFWGYEAALQGQLRLTSSLSFSVAAQYISSNVDNARGTADGTSFTIQFPDQVNFGAALHYQLIQDRLVMQLAGSYQLLGSRRDLYGDPAFDRVAAQRTRHAVGLGFVYSF